MPTGAAVPLEVQLCTSTLGTKFSRWEGEWRELVLGPTRISWIKDSRISDDEGFVIADRRYPVFLRQVSDNYPSGILQ